MHFLASRKPKRRGDNISMIFGNEYSGKAVTDVLWIDRQRRYYVSSWLTTNQGTPISRERWRAVDRQNTKVQLDQFVLGVIEKHYENCCKIDRQQVPLRLF